MHVAGGDAWQGSLTGRAKEKEAAPTGGHELVRIAVLDCLCCTDLVEELVRVGAARNGRTEGSCRTSCVDLVVEEKQLGGVGAACNGQTEVLRRAACGDLVDESTPAAASPTGAGLVTLLLVLVRKCAAECVARRPKCTRRPRAARLAAGGCTGRGDAASCDDLLREASGCGRSPTGPWGHGGTV